MCLQNELLGQRVKSNMRVLNRTKLASFYCTFVSFLNLLVSPLKNRLFKNERGEEKCGLSAENSTLSRELDVG